MTPEAEKVAVDQIKQRDDVQRALKQTASAYQNQIINQPVEAKHKFWLVSYLLLLIGLAGIYYLFRLQFFSFAGKYVSPLQRLTLGAMMVVVALGIAGLCFLTSGTRSVSRSLTMPIWNSSPGRCVK
jgi:hypothetical protein